jgi:hypothetical protein
MKKVILSLVFMFPLGSSYLQANSNSTSEISKDIIAADCFEMADIGARVLGSIYDLDYESEHEVFFLIYDECVEQN